MKRLRIGVIDLVAPRPGGSMWSKMMNASFASVMPQAISVWCEEQGHSVTYVCYTGREDLATCLPRDVDLAFIGSFTEASHLAYALSAYLRSRGAVTALGGPHARCFPQDSQRYFDYVFGFKRNIIVAPVVFYESDVLRPADFTPACSTCVGLTSNRQFVQNGGGLVFRGSPTVSYTHLTLPTIYSV